MEVLRIIGRRRSGRAGVIIVGGERPPAPAYQRAVREAVVVGVRLKVWGWEGEIPDVYTSLSEEFPGQVVVCHLDSHREVLRYRGGSSDADGGGEAAVGGESGVHGRPNILLQATNLLSSLATCSTAAYGAVPTSPPSATAAPSSTARTVPAPATQPLPPIAVRSPLPSAPPLPHPSSTRAFRSAPNGPPVGFTAHPPSAQEAQQDEEVKEAGPYSQGTYAAAAPEVRSRAAGEMEGGSHPGQGRVGGLRPAMMRMAMPMMSGGGVLATPAMLFEGGQEGRRGEGPRNVMGPGGPGDEGEGEDEDGEDTDEEGWGGIDLETASAVSGEDRSGGEGSSEWTMSGGTTNFSGSSEEGDEEWPEVCVLLSAMIYVLVLTTMLVNVKA